MLNLWSSLVYPESEQTYTRYPLRAEEAICKLTDASSSKHVVAVYSHPPLQLHKKGQICLSVDVDCLAVQVYMKLCKIPHIVLDECQPAQSPTGQLPFAVFLSRFPKDTTKLVIRSETIVEECRTRGFDLDADLSDSDRSRVFGFRLMLDQQLKPALFFNLFCEPENVDDVTGHFAHQNLAWPARYLISREYRQWAVTYMKSTVSKSITETPVDVELVYSNFNDGLKGLSELLGTKQQYLLGSKPCSLDAFAFAYIDLVMGFAQVVRAEGNTRLKDAVFQYDNIVTWYNQIKSKVW